jgi:peroxiredoxin Q/BCP
MECKSLRDSGEELSRFDIAYFAASVDNAETNREFADSLNLNYPILSDPDKKVAAAYGVLNDSQSYARRWTFYIDSRGKIAKIDRQVSPSSAGNDLVKTLVELGFPKK